MAYVRYSPYPALSSFFKDKNMFLLYVTRYWHFILSDSPIRPHERCDISLLFNLMKNIRHKISGNIFWKGNL